MRDVGLLTNEYLDTWIQLDFTYSTNPEAIEWCNNYEGGKYALGWTHIWFSSEETAILFALKFIGVTA